MKKTIGLRLNADGTYTAIFGTDRTTFTPQPWWTEAELFDHAKWSFILLGVDISNANEMKTEVEHGTEAE